MREMQKKDAKPGTAKRWVTYALMATVLSMSLPPVALGDGEEVAPEPAIVLEVRQESAPADDVSAVRGAIDAGSVQATPVAPTGGGGGTTIAPTSSDLLPKTGDILGMVVEDADLGGTFGDEDPGLGSWALELLDADGRLLETTETGPGGRFAFLNLVPGTYQVREVLKPLWIRSFPADERGYEVSVVSGMGEVPRVNFGNIRLAEVSGYVFYDLNGNGLWEKDGVNPESPLVGWQVEATEVLKGTGDEAVSLEPPTVTLGGVSVGTSVVQALGTETAPGPTVKAMTTGPDGRYHFAFEPGELGEWKLEVAKPASWQETSPLTASTTLAVRVVGGSVAGPDFGEIQYFEAVSMLFAPTNGNASATPSAIVIFDGMTSIAGVHGASSMVATAGTVVSRADGAPFSIAALAAADPLGSLGGLPAGSVLDGAVSWGLPGALVAFSKPVLVSVAVPAALNEQVLSIVRSESGTDSWTSDGIGTPGTCTVSSGFCSFTATESGFIAVTHVPPGNPVSPPPPPPGGNGNSDSSGGGSGSGGGGDSGGGNIPNAPSPTPQVPPPPVPFFGNETFPAQAPALSANLLALNLGEAAPESTTLAAGVPESETAIGEGSFTPLSEAVTPPEQPVFIGLANLVTFGTGSDTVAFLVFLAILLILFYLHDRYFTTEPKFKHNQSRKSRSRR